MSAKQNKSSWEDQQKYKEYKSARISREEDIDYFQCTICQKYKDSFDESSKRCICVECNEENNSE